MCLDTKTKLQTVALLINFESKYCDSFILFFFRMILAIVGALCFHMTSSQLYNFIRSHAELLIRLAVNTDQMARIVIIIH